MDETHSVIGIGPGAATKKREKRGKIYNYHFPKDRRSYERDLNKYLGERQEILNQADRLRSLLTFSPSNESLMMLILLKLYGQTPHMKRSSCCIRQRRILNFHYGSKIMLPLYFCCS